MRTEESVITRINQFFQKCLRKIYSGVKCCREHGVRYTLHYSLEKLRLLGNNRVEPEIVRDYAYYSSLSPKKYAKELKLWYKNATGETLNLYRPKTFNEKLQWLKLYDSTPLKTRLADKYLVRDWVKEKIGEEYLIPLLGVWDSFGEIDFDKLPDRFVLKANHGSGWNIIVKDKSEFNKAEAKERFDAWMKTNYAFITGFELHYMNIPPKTIAEQFIETVQNDLVDYKVFCFDGKAKSIQVITNRKTNIQKVFYDLSWNRIYADPTQGNNADESADKLERLSKLVSLAENLATGFSFVRVDFYITDDGMIKFGEMTFTPASGVRKWENGQQNADYGELIKFPTKSPIPKREF